MTSCFLKFQINNPLQDNESFTPISPEILNWSHRDYVICHNELISNGRMIDFLFGEETGFFAFSLFLLNLQMGMTVMSEYK